MEFFLALIILWSAMAFGQEDTYKYVVFLMDKNGSSYSLNNPEAFMSNEAIERRQRFNIPVQINDIPVVENYKDQLEALGYKVISSSNWLNAVLIESSDALNESMLSEEPFIKDAQWVSVYNEGGRNELVSTENHTYVWQEEQESKYGVAAKQINMLNGEFLHSNGYQGQDITIGVLDAGFSNVDELEAFAKLRNENRLIATKDFVDYDEDVYESSGHGTSVLSTMAGHIKDTYVGTAPKANYALIITEDARYEQLIEEFNYVLGLEYADQIGVDIINTSLGYTLFNYEEMDHQTEDLNGDISMASKAADIAASKGMLIINSAGNKGDDPWTNISIPSDGDSVFCIGSVNVAGERSVFSGIGYDMEDQVKPNVMAMGEAVAVVKTDGTIDYSNGTSFSSPIIAGLTACLWQAFPEYTNMEIIKAIEESSSQYLSPDNFMGYGIPDFQAAYALLYQRKHELDLAEDNITIFPNPFSDHLTLTLPETVNQDLSISLVNEIGQDVFNEVISSGARKTLNIQIPGISTLSNGLYFLKVKTIDDVFMFKLVKV